MSFHQKVLVCCGKFLTLFSVVMSELKVGKTVSNTIAASEVDYYKATLAANEFLYIKAKAPASGGLTIALKGQVDLNCIC